VILRDWRHADLYLSARQSERGDAMSTPKGDEGRAAKRVAVMAYLSVPLADQLNARCHRLGISRSSAVVQAIASWLLREAGPRRVPQTK
jgi:hypothetical protein